MIRMNQLKLPVSHSGEQLRERVAKRLRVSETEIRALHIRRQSLDARKKPDLHYVYTVDVEVPKEKRVLERSRCHQAALAQRQSYQFPRSGTERMGKR